MKNQNFEYLSNPNHRWELPGNYNYFEKYGKLRLYLENYALLSFPPIFTNILYTYPLSNIFLSRRKIG